MLRWFFDNLEEEICVSNKGHLRHENSLTDVWSRYSTQYIIRHPNRFWGTPTIFLSFLSWCHLMRHKNGVSVRVHTSSSILENSTRSKSFFDTRSLLEYQFYVRVLLELDSKFFEKLASTRNVLWIVDRWRNVIFSHKILKCLLFWDIILILQSFAIVWDYC